MNSKDQILKELDAAIEARDMSAVENGLHELGSGESGPSVMPEDPKLFAAKIIKLNEEKNTMKYSRKHIRAAIVAAAVLLMGVTAYAAVTGSLFTFGSGDRYVTVRSNDEMTEQEARDMAKESAEREAAREAGEAEDDANVITDVPEQSFGSVEEAEAGMDMVIPMPANMPDMKLESATGQTIEWGDGSELRSVWLTYADDAGRLFGVTVTRDIIPEGAADSTRYSESDMDEGSLGSYLSKTGVTYNTLTESDETGERTAHIATVALGEYQYALVFYGFDDAERFAVIDSVDLSEYK